MGNASFSCEATGIKRPTISWWREESGGLVQITGVDSRTVIEEQDLGEFSTQSILLVLSTQLFDAGEYTCRAQNLVGTDEATAELIVHG